MGKAKYENYCEVRRRSSSYAGQSSHVSFKVYTSTLAAGAARRSPLWAKTGGADRGRTGGLMIANHALYQLSYSPTRKLKYTLKDWPARRSPQDEDWWR